MAAPKTLTKAQLAAELAALRESYQRLEQRLALELARNSTPAPRPQPAAPSATALSPFRIACARARELAMRSGASVKVGG
jgi:hypothetical protein